jgi:hypothetical protein
VSDSAKAAIRAARGWRLAYVSSPFSKFDGGHWRAFVAAARSTASLLRLGVHAYSPIVHGYPLCMYGGIKAVNHEFWMDADRPMMELAQGMIVLTLPGWEVSEGVIEEIKAFTVAGKPIVHVKPEDLE